MLSKTILRGKVLSKIAGDLLYLLIGNNSLFVFGLRHTLVVIHILYRTYLVVRSNVWILRAGRKILLSMYCAIGKKCVNYQYLEFRLNYYHCRLGL
jgi:hypothetical protein